VLSASKGEKQEKEAQSLAKLEADNAAADSRKVISQQEGKIHELADDVQRLEGLLLQLNEEHQREMVALTQAYKQSTTKDHGLFLHHLRACVSIIADHDFYRNRRRHFEVSGHLCCLRPRKSEWKDGTTFVPRFAQG